ncbi:hypothetical protein NDU88_002449 [Pleurodeles waltl]|uniref:Secreted protein n=1 Tax=Pleurodeles waltl TaxID=8319 RepID=A0AAV7VDR5_PLEWA|nr:hypothetical protein NDU88_002449 [Pleurodeles waltl]
MFGLNMLMSAGPVAAAPPTTACFSPRAALGVLCLQGPLNEAGSPDAAHHLLLFTTVKRPLWRLLPKAQIDFGPTSQAIIMPEDAQ